ncbi:hypothetical protein [Clostridium sp. HBUAS56010]|uniref:hypothetical protein n=1 Tax=Clostridium sp. HBUAS56010 TaxID=2571127 RepID=UPI0011779114|nr:hypothetical protein [Clostridium sp. HBUAS56010]
MIKKIILSFSIILNLCFLIVYLNVLFNNSDTSNGIDQEEPLEPIQSVDENVGGYELGSTITYNQLFIGKWKIVDSVSSDLSLPSSYSGFDKEGNFRGPDITSIIGEEIIFDVDKVEFSGNKYQYAYGPETYTHALRSEEEQIGYNYAGSLGITGEYYSIIYFLLPNNYQVKRNQKYVRKLRIDDLCFLYIKDNETIYASDGTITYLLKRLS